jgi:hypothetical protein
MTENLKQYNLNQNQITTWQQAYNLAKEKRQKGICFGNLPNTNDGKQFFAPFIQAGYIEKKTLKYTGVFVLTDKGIAKFDELLSKL